MKMKLTLPAFLTAISMCPRRWLSQLVQQSGQELLARHLVVENGYSIPIFSTQARVRFN